LRHELQAGMEKSVLAQLTAVDRTETEQLKERVNVESEAMLSRVVQGGLGVERGRPGGRMFDINKFLIN